MTCAAPTSPAGSGQLVRLLPAPPVAALLVLYLGTSARTVGFDDAAELAYCASAWSVAHPPGYPAWTALAHGWTVLVPGLDPMVVCAAFSSFCSAGAILALWSAFAAVLGRAPGSAGAPRCLPWAAGLAALGCGLGRTVWQWSNAVEVYSFQLLCTALVLLGVARDDGTRRRFAMLTGLGIGLGLANHHLSMVLLLPFLPLCAAGLWRTRVLAAARRLLRALPFAVAVAVFCYALLWWRAQGAYRFEFNDPSTLPRLWHHLRGGFFGDSFFAAGIDTGGRARVLAEVLLFHFGPFAVPAVLGLASAWRHCRPLALGLGGHAALALAVQLGRTHLANMDAALLPALALLSVFVALGLPRLLALPYGRGAAIAALLLHLLLNSTAGNRRGYEVGDALMADLDASAPPRSVLLLTNWELRMTCELYRDLRGFRPDLVVLSSSLKGTNPRSLPLAYPEFHAAVRREYEAFLAAVAAVDSDYVFTDYYAISTAELQRTYGAMLARVFAVAEQEERPVLMDRQTAAFLLEAAVLRHEEIHPCGVLFSRGRLAEPRRFTLAEGWLDHPFLRHDLCAYAMFDNYVVTARQMAGYYRHRGDREGLAAVERVLRTLEPAWEAYRRGMPAPPRRR